METLLLLGGKTGALMPDEAILNDTLLPEKLAGTDPKLTGMGNNFLVPGRLEPGETPTG